MSKGGEGNISSKKIVLNRKPAPVANIPASSVSGNQELNTSTASDSSNNDKSETKRVIKLGSLSAEERAKLRAEKFGVPVPDSLKKAARAERFGVSNSGSTVAKDLKVLSLFFRLVHILLALI